MAGKAVGNQETDQERSGRRDMLLHFRGRAAVRPAGAKEATAVWNRRGALQRGVPTLAFWLARVEVLQNRVHPDSLSAAINHFNISNALF